MTAVTFDHLPTFGAYTDLEYALCSARAARAFGGPILIRSDKPLMTARVTAHLGGDVVVDCGAWSRTVATPDEPLDLPGGDGVFPVDLVQWSRSTRSRLNASAVLSPSRFVACADWRTLDALIAAINAAAAPATISFIPTAESMLAPQNLERFIAAVGSVRGPRAVLFADQSARSFVNKDHIRGLRRLVGAVPDLAVVGVAPLIAVDSLVHGAGSVYLGSRSGLRSPTPPGVVGRVRFSQGWIPGTFVRDLCEMRSPRVYADWYANTSSPICAECGHALDNFTDSDRDKEAIVAHNLHATADWINDCASRPAQYRARALHRDRLDAFLAHQALFTSASDYADLTLRALVEVDDPLTRTARQNGTLV